MDSNTGSDGFFVVEISGDLTIYDVSQHKLVFEALLAKHQPLRLNFSAVDDIDTAGVQLILSVIKALQEQGLEFTCCQMSAEVEQTFELLGAQWVVLNSKEAA